MAKPLYVRLAVALSVFLLSAASLAQVESVEPTRAKWISMERQRCFGYCPIYRIEIYRDGHVVFNGEEFTLETGRHELRLETNQVRELEELISESGILELDDDCCSCYDVSDQPTVTIEIVIGSTPKVIEHYHGCIKAPAWLAEFESSLDDLSGAIRWIGTGEERRQKRRSDRK